MKKLIITSVFIGFMAFAAHAQDAACPVGEVCIPQEVANKLADLAEQGKKVPGLEGKIAALEEARGNDTKTIERLKLELAVAVEGKIAAENKNTADNAYNKAIIEFLLINGRKKCGVLTLICVQ